MFQHRLLAINSMIRCCTRTGQLEEGLQLFQQVLQEGLTPDKVTFLSVISAIGGQTTFKQAKWMHTYIFASGYELDIMVSTSLIHMYGKHHCIDHAKCTFETMLAKNEVTWNAMITAMSQNRQNEAALFFFAQMESEGILPTRVTYIVIVNVYTSMRDLCQGTRIHARIFAAGCASDVVVECALVTFYGKCGSIGNAERVFSQILVPNVVAWTSMITVYGETEKSKEAYHWFFQMQEQEVSPNEVTFISLVDLCARRMDFGMGKHFHALIVSLGYDVSVGITNALIHFYGKCDHTKECWKLFDGMQIKDVISWNGMISACTCNGQSLEAIMLFLRLCESGITPTKATLISTFEACGNLGMVSQAYTLHFYALDASIELDPQLKNALVSLYGSCKSLSDAQTLFSETIKGNVVTWNALLGAFVQHEKGNDALTLFGQMLVEGVLPNNVTMITLFSACACHNWLLNEGKHLHACWLVGCGNVVDIAVSNALLNMYCKCGSSWEAHRSFFCMSKHNTASFNVLMSMCVDHNQTTKVLPLFNAILSEGLIPDEGSFVSVFNACASEGSLAEVNRMHVCLVSQKRFMHNSALQNSLMYARGKCSDVEGAWEVFDELPEQDVVAWNTLIAASAEGSFAPPLFSCMLHQAIIPDEVTYIAIATSCAGQAIWALASRVLARIVDHSQTLSNVVLGTALIQMQGNCGQVKNALITFNTILKRNLIAWNTMLRVCSRCGKGKDMLELLQQMQLEGVTPDKITFVAVLSACGHEGLVAEAINLLSVIESNHVSELIEDHYSCMLDGLGRAGQLDGAEFLLKTMSLQVFSVPALAFLSACKIHADFERGRRIYTWIIEQEVHTAEAYLEVANFFDVVCVDEENAKDDEIQQRFCAKQRRNLDFTF